MDVRNDKANISGPVGSQLPGSPERTIIILLNHSVDFCPGGIADVALTGNNQ